MLVSCGRFSLSYTHSETVLALIHLVHGRFVSHFCVGFEAKVELIREGDKDRLLTFFFILLGVAV